MLSSPNLTGICISEMDMADWPFAEPGQFLVPQMFCRQKTGTSWPE